MADAEGLCVRARRAALALVVAAFGAAAAAPGCGSREAREAQNEAAVASPEQVSQGFVLTRSAGGVKQWDLKAAVAEIFEGGDMVVLTDLHVDFYDSTGAHSGRLTAGKGKIQQKQNVMDVESNVVLEGRDGAVLRTERLTWSEETGRVTTDAYVEIERAAEKLTGWGLEATPDLATAIVKSRVRVSGTRPSP